VAAKTNDKNKKQAAKIAALVCNNGGGDCFSHK